MKQLPGRSDYSRACSQWIATHALPAAAATHNAGGREKNVLRDLCLDWMQCLLDECMHGIIGRCSIAPSSLCQSIVNLRAPYLHDTRHTHTSRTRAHFNSPCTCRLSWITCKNNYLQLISLPEQVPTKPEKILVMCPSAAVCANASIWSADAERCTVAQLIVSEAVGTKAFEGIFECQARNFSLAMISMEMKHYDCVRFKLTNLFWFKIFGHFIHVVHFWVLAIFCFCSQGNGIVN